MRKILSSVLCLVLIFSLSACGGSLKGAEETAKAFMDSYCLFNLKDAFGYIENQEAYTLPFDDLDSAIVSVKSSMTAEMSEEEASDYVDSFIAPIFTKFVEKLSYEIVSSEEQDDKFIFNIELKSINSQNLSTAEYNPEELLLELNQELYENGTITDDMTQEQIAEVMMKPMMEKMTGFILETIENAGTETKNITLVVKRLDGKYVITDESSLTELINSANIAQ